MTPLTPPTARAQFGAMKKRARKGEPAAMYELGMAYYSGKFAAFGTPAPLSLTINRPKALGLFLAAAELGYASAQMAAGYALVRKTCGQQDFDKGVSLLVKAAEAGNPHAKQELHAINTELEALIAADPGIQLITVPEGTP